MRSCGVCATDCRKKTEGFADPARGRWIIVWHKMRSDLPTSERIDQYSVWHEEADT